MNQPTAFGLEALQPQVAGIDIGSRYMHVCGPPVEDQQGPVQQFATTTEEILKCAEWLKQQGVVSVALESTGVYWIPVLELLESAGFEVLLVDTRPLSRVPGRKTDVLDCRWIQKLHSCGLLQSCYRPTPAISELRGLTRAKAVLVAEQADWIRRMHKELDQMNVRVHHAVSDLNGTTGMNITRAIVAGERDPHQLAALRDPRCQKSPEQIVAYLTGHWRPDHLFNLERWLKMYDTVGEAIQDYDREIQRRLQELTPPDRTHGPSAPPLGNRERMKAFKRRKQESKRDALFRMMGVDLTSIDGIGVEAAEAVVSEYGTDLSKFDHEKQFVAHLQLAPRRCVSGGKQLKKRRGRGKANRVTDLLRNAATTLQRSRTALGAYYRRISRTKGASVAVFATARKLAIYLFRLIKWGQAYFDEGQQAYEQRFQARRLRAISSQAKEMGYELAKLQQSANI